MSSHEYMDRLSLMMELLTKPLGEYAPKRRDFTIDYTDAGGDNYTQEMTAWVPKGAADGSIVRAFLAPLEASGATVNLIAELSGDTFIVRYASPELLKEVAANA